jgi:hypothetical protein
MLRALRQHTLQKKMPQRNDDSLERASKRNCGMHALDSAYGFISCASSPKRKSSVSNEARRMGTSKRCRTCSFSLSWSTPRLRTFAFSEIHC